MDVMKFICKEDNNEGCFKMRSSFVGEIWLVFKSLIFSTSLDFYKIVVCHLLAVVAMNVRYNVPFSQITKTKDTHLQSIVHWYTYHKLQTNFNGSVVSTEEP